ncbi:MAG: heme lyase CcmF/NrfE family subunit [Robiginitomaculum sp.]|nr:heme lyase CcmF/NrfE family subunit [Robiginitomaculum sp.]
MIAEIGQIALILAFLIAVAQSVLPMVGAHKADARLMAFGDKAALAQFILLGVSFIALTIVFVQSDFSVKLVTVNSHTDKPLLYKISGVWGNHEGSMLLWVLILGIYGALVPIYGKNLPAGLKARALSVQGMISVGFLGFILFTSNPFLRLNPVPINGQGLNPLLQDPGLAFHPPFLYLGYVGFSMAFSFSVAALIEGRVDAVWARWLRPWVLLAWSFLTIGITMGSIWAYYELGWGGWWMWDPVENVSFLPWLVGTALLHSILVLGKRHAMAHWTILLGITAFSLSLVGTFVVRSGVLTSVHSFAVDPARGVYILALLLLATGGGLVMFALRAHTLRGGPGFTLVSKEGGLLLNNLLLVTATFTVFLGTFYPLLIEAFTDGKISVGEPYFDRTFAPVMIVLIAFMGVGPLVKWRKDSWQSLRPHLLKSLLLVLVISGLTWWLGKSVLGALSIGVAAYLAYSTLVAFGRKIKFGQTGSMAGSMKLLRAQPAAVWGFLLGHMGIAICVVGITAMSVWAGDSAKVMKLGESMTVSGYEFTLTNMTPGAERNFQKMVGEVEVTKQGRKVATLKSARRFYQVRDMITTEAGIQVRPMRNLYVGVGEGDAEKGWVVRAYVHPMVNWIWLGALMIALAGFVSILDRGQKREVSS